MKPDVAALVRELRATLDQIGDALINGSLDDLIATESRLAGIASTFGTGTFGAGTFGGAFGADGFGQTMSANALSPAVPPSELDAALSALRRCQRLGDSFNEVGASWFEVGGGQAYTRAGRSPVSTTFTGRTATFDTRV
jgi:hypothetical protein